MKTTAYVSHPDCSRHDTGWRHPEHQGRLPAVARAVYRDMLTLFEPLLEVEARPASLVDLRLVHTEGYIGRVRARAEEAARAGGVLPLEDAAMVSGASFEAAIAAVGAVLTAVDAVLAGDVRNAFCATRPPGHGASADSPGAFSLFNQVAVAARHLRERRGLERVLIVELGAHPGLGTAAILAGDPGIRLLSLHQGSLATGADWPAGALPVSLAAGARGEDALRALEDGLERGLRNFTPDFLLLSLGCDALASDPLGGLELAPADYFALTESLRSLTDKQCAGRLVSGLEGGYDPRGTGEAVVQHLRALVGLPPA